MGGCGEKRQGGKRADHVVHSGARRSGDLIVAANLLALTRDVALVSVTMMWGLCVGLAAWP